ncbi:hypothetical protein [Streptomyces lydicus]|uniref:hypothetical protein n=1 Tax=Streptomyces lydicus TaxID=47763 RepID=UPI0010129314|nr:hypothetical protein [Streptomyces lydicus]MCZ1008961.1 hypothetical protein [Streptomyces lydicus]
MMTDSDTADELTEALDSLTLPLRSNEGLDEEALEKASSVLRQCEQEWDGRSLIPREALAELVDVYAALNGVSYAYPEPARSAIGRAARELQGLALSTVKKQRVEDEVILPAEVLSLADRWDSVLRETRDLQQVPSQKLSDFLGVLDGLTEELQDQDEIPRTLARTLISLFPSLVEIASEFDSAAQQEVMDSAVEVQEHVWEFVNADADDS